jgi:glutamyl-tRNA synthetase
MTTPKIRTRFAPSPTGFLHIGGARTALFNWLFARHHGGDFLLRIEDTDQKRSSEDAVTGIFDSLSWLGINVDEPAVFQSKNIQRHVAVAQELVAQDKAYYCYCSPEELEVMREQAKAEGRATVYDRRWRDADPKDAPADIAPVIRIKAPLDGEITIDDAVQGSVTVHSKQLDDFILLRSDGTPTYMLSVVVDDYDMGITHIIRGDDHLNNAFRQKIIIDAMGWNTPVYAHVPLIHGVDGAKLSKRHGAQGVDEFINLGYMPEGVNNALLRLGWGHGDEEIIDQARAISLFGLDGIGRAPARLDYTKMESINAHYLRAMDDADLLTSLMHWMDTQNLESLNAQQQAWIVAGMTGLKDRAKTFVDLYAETKPYRQSVPISYDEKAAQTLQSEDAKAAIIALYQALEALSDFTESSIDAATRQLAADQFDQKLGRILMPLRAAITGSTQSPPLQKLMEILGKDEVLARLKAV